MSVPAVREDAAALHRDALVLDSHYVRSFLDPSAWQRRGASSTAGQPSLVEHILDHIEHIIRVAGPAHIGLGSDLDGGGTALRDATELPPLTQGLLDRGHSESTIRAILGENLLRAFAQTG